MLSDLQYDSDTPETSRTFGGFTVMQNIIMRMQGLIGRDKKTLDDKTTTFAAFADTAYARTASSKKRKLADVLGETQWELDTTNTSAHQTVWVNEATHEVVTSYRGTVPTEFEDLAADAAIVLGHEHSQKRFKKAIRDYDMIQDDYAGYDHYLASHSLGGAINNVVYETYRDDIIEVHNYNPGASVSAAKEAITASILDAFGANHIDEDIHNYHVHGDPISVLSIANSGHTNHVIEPLKGSVNPHSHQQFLR